MQKYYKHKNIAKNKYYYNLGILQMHEYSSSVSITKIENNQGAIIFHWEGGRLSVCDCQSPIFSGPRKVKKNIHVTQPMERAVIKLKCKCPDIEEKGQLPNQIENGAGTAASIYNAINAIV